MILPFASPEERHCVNPRCLVGRWVVTQQSEYSWQIVSTIDNHPFVVEAPMPKCPCCGSLLLTALEIDGGFADASQVEEGPLFDFIRTMR